MVRNKLRVALDKTKTSRGEGLRDFAPCSCFIIKEELRRLFKDGVVKGYRRARKNHNNPGQIKKVAEKPEVISERSTYPSYC